MFTGYLQRLRLIRRDAWLVMTAWLTFGLTQRGVFAVLFNLYLLRLDYGPAFIGLINAVWLLTFAVLALPAGLLARRWNHRSMMIVGKSLEAAGFSLSALADLVPPPWRTAWLLATYSLAGIGGAAWSAVYTPFLFAATGPEERDHAFAVATVSNPAAGLVGNLAGGLLPGLFAVALGLTLGHAAPYRLTLLLAGLLDFTAVLALLGTRDVQGIQEPRQAPRDRGPFPFAVVAVMSLSYLLFAAAYAPMLTFINVFLSARLGTPIAVVGAILATARLLSIPAGLTSPLLAARWGRLRATTTMFGALAASFTLLLILPHWAAVGVAFTLALVAYLFVSAITTVYSQEMVAPEWRATISGSINMALGLGLGIVSLFGGHIIAGWGYSALFALCAALSLASAALFWVYFRVPRGEIRETD